MHRGAPFATPCAALPAPSPAGMLHTTTGRKVERKKCHAVDREKIKTGMQRPPPRPAPHPPPSPQSLSWGEGRGREGGAGTRGDHGWGARRARRLGTAPASGKRSPFRHSTGSTAVKDVPSSRIGFVPTLKHPHPATHTTDTHTIGPVPFKRTQSQAPPQRCSLAWPRVQVRSDPTQPRLLPVRTEAGRAWRE